MYRNQTILDKYETVVRVRLGHSFPFVLKNLTSRCARTGSFDEFDFYLGRCCSDCTRIDSTSDLGTKVSGRLLSMIMAFCLINTFLWFSRNRLQYSSSSELLKTAFPSLTVLQLNGTLMTWQESLCVVSTMPNLQVLEMGYNHLSRLSQDTDDPVSVIPAIQTVNLDNNNCNDWPHVFASLKKLNSYVLNPYLMRRTNVSRQVTACCSNFESNQDNTMPSTRATTSPS